MHGVSGSSLARASNPAIASDSESFPIAGSDTEKQNTVGSDSDDEDWFARVAWALLGKLDTGLALHVVSGSPEGSCYKYVARNSEARRQPPAYLIRTLLRSEQGYQWLAGIMDGASPQWWREIQSARDDSTKARAFIASLLPK